MTDTNVVNCSYVGLLSGYNYAVGCSDRVGCGAANAAARFSLLSCAGNGSTLAGSVLDVSGVRVSAPSPLPSSSQVAFVLLDNGVAVGGGLRVLAKCSTSDRKLIATVSQVVFVASRPAALNQFNVDYICMSPSLAASMTHTTFVEHTMPDTPQLPLSHTTGTLTTSLCPPRDTAPPAALSAVSPLLVFVMSAIAIAGGVAADPSAAADLQLLAGLPGSPCLQRGGSDDTVSRYLMSPFADTNNHVSVVLGNIALVFAVLAAQGAAASYFARGSALGSNGLRRLVVSALTQVPIPAKNAAVVRAQLPNWAMHAALFRAVLSMSTGAAGTIVGGGVAGAAWIVCISVAAADRGGKA